MPMRRNIFHSLTTPSYDGLKKRIYLVEKQQSGLDTNYHDIESQHSPLLGHSDSDQIFSQYLDRELRKITIFYQSQAVEFLEDAEVLEVQVAEQEEAEMRNYPEFDEEDEDEEDEDGEREGEDETAPQPGETSKPRKKGVVTYCWYPRSSLAETVSREKTKELNPPKVEFIFKRRRCRPRCRYIIPSPRELLPAGKITKGVCSYLGQHLEYPYP